MVFGAGGKNCRRIGTYEREKEKQETTTTAQEYNGIDNRLKVRKRRGRITPDERNRKVRSPRR